MGCGFECDIIGGVVLSEVIWGCGFECDVIRDAVIFCALIEDVFRSLRPP